MEDEMVRWHNQCNGHDFEQAPGDSEGPGSLVCCSPWGGKELDTAQQLNNNGMQKYKDSFHELEVECLSPASFKIQHFLQFSFLEKGIQAAICKHFSKITHLKSGPCSFPMNKKPD